MLTAYDCFDLHNIFTSIRNTPDDPENILIIQQLATILEMLREKKDISANSCNIRNFINISSDNVKWHLGYHDRYYTGQYFCTNDAVINSLKKILYKMLLLSQNGEFALLERLADRIHEIPLKMLENNKYERKIIKISRHL